MTDGDDWLPFILNHKLVEPPVTGFNYAGGMTVLLEFPSGLRFGGESLFLLSDQEGSLAIQVELDYGEVVALFSRSKALKPEEVRELEKLLADEKEERHDTS